MKNMQNFLEEYKGRVFQVYTADGGLYDGMLVDMYDMEMDLYLEFVEYDVENQMHTGNVSWEKLSEISLTMDIDDVEECDGDCENCDIEERDVQPIEFNSRRKR